MKGRGKSEEIQFEAKRLSDEINIAVMQSVIDDILYR